MYVCECYRDPVLSCTLDPWAIYLGELSSCLTVNDILIAINRFKKNAEISVLRPENAKMTNRCLRKCTYSTLGKNIDLRYN